MISMTDSAKGIMGLFRAVRSLARPSRQGFFGRKMDNRYFVLGFVLVFLPSCAVREKTPALGPAGLEGARQVSFAHDLSRRGSYVALKQAVNLYMELYARPEFRKDVARSLTEAALLLSVREKELGMSNTSYLDTALRVIRENRMLIALAPYAEIAGVYWVQGKGVMADVDERFPWKEAEEKLKGMGAELREKAKEDEFSAYMYAALRCFLASPSEALEGPGELAARFPDSLLLAYKNATCPSEDEERLKGLLAREPDFYEAAYHLGLFSLSRGNLLEAEGYFLKTHEGIPESAQVTILLATIAFAMDEVERSLEFYNKTLDIVPNYRDALLGKAICLSTLGRPEEAIAVCEKLIALGYWLLGESHYWLAWNKHELKDEAAAEANIEQAKGRLPTSTKVFTLSGLIAAEREDLAKAEKDFREAIVHNAANSQALFNLGALYAREENWTDSGLHFEKAAFAFENEGRTLQAKITEALYSSLAPERKERYLARRKSQLEKALLSRATGFYNAAAGYFNAGQKYKALEMATRAAEHPAFKQKAEDLASGIK